MEKEPGFKRIIVADDHVSVREGLTQIIECTSGVRVIKAVDNGDALIQATEQLHPDIVITDIRMPGKDGVEAGGIIKDKFPGIGLIAYISDENDFLFLNLLKAGFDGIILKRSERKETIMAINMVLAGQEYFCGAAQNRIRVLIQKGLYNPRRKTVKEILSNKEYEILLLTCKGLTSQQIASIILLSSRTVESYRSKLIKMAGVTNPAGLVHYAYASGIIEYSHGCADEGGAYIPPV
jgi:two-component system, NarL family, response regulator NreC